MDPHFASRRNVRCLAQVAVVAALCASGSARASDAVRLSDLSGLLDSCRRVEAPVFAPDAWEDALKNYNRARTLHEQGGRQTELDGKLELASRRAHEAIDISTEVRDQLSPVLEARTRARAARAQFQVPREYGRAEEILTAAARKVESGNRESGLSEARRAEPLFDAAELAAIQRTILRAADSLLAAADSARAGRYAPVTLGQANELRTQAYEGLLANRYDTLAAAGLANQAESQARHAMALCQYIRKLDLAHVSWEQWTLDYEGELARLAAAAGLEPPPFHVGPEAAVDSLAAALSSVASDLTMAGSELAQVSTVLGRGLAETGESSPSAHPVELATQAAERLTRLTEEKADWARMAQARQAQLAEVSQMADETAYELTRRQEREKKFKAAANLLTVSEGVVLYNDHDDIVLRLTGLSFDPGESTLLPRHEKVLAKVATILESFDGQGIVVEGHTDARGTASGNLTLSQKRADAVRAWLAKHLKGDPARLEAKGFGDSRPVASNSSSDGRTKNRRIDVVILK